MVLNPRFGQVEQDLQYIAKEQLPGPGLRRFTLDQKQKDRLYQKVFDLLNYKKWHVHQGRNELMTHLQHTAKSWIEPRYLFDAAVGFLSQRRTAIPKYTVLQTLISQTMSSERQRIAALLVDNLTVGLATTLTTFLGNDGALPLSKLRRSAKSFSPAELEKELEVNRHIQPWIKEIDAVVTRLSLSIKNLQHLASMVDYYGSKISRFDQWSQYLYLLCYLQERGEKNRERLADGFVYHAKKVRDEAKIYANDAAYRDWEGAAANMGKAAELLHFFIDESIDETQPFAVVKRKANKRLGHREIESLCLYLNKQKRTVDDYHWEFYDKQKQLIETVLRPLFLCLDFEATATTRGLAAQLAATKAELLAGSVTRTYDRRLIQKKQVDYLTDDNGDVIPSRFEWLLYLQIPLYTKILSP